MTNEEKWMEHYSLLKKYVSEHGHLPDKKQGGEPRAAQLVEI